MNRNTSSHFSENPVNIDIQRSKFRRDSQHKTTFNTGDLIPIYVDEVLPGDTMQMSMATAMRMSTPIYPVMDNCSCDFYFFFVPNRLVWEHWREFMGENRTTHWEQPVEYEIPQIKAPDGGWSKGTIADYMGIPTQVGNIQVSALFFRAYCLIWNEWFRDQNLKDPAMVNLDDATQTGSNGDEYITDAQLGGMPLKAAKFHDYFTSALPEPQKGPEILIPLGNIAPVKSGIAHDTTNDEPWIINIHGTNKAAGNGSLAVASSWVNVTTGDSAGQIGRVVPANLYADLQNATAATVNQLRQAFAIQRLYEKFARGGTRYTELIRANFDVISPDGRQQRPEYLGGMSLPINIDQVLQTSQTTETSPQGNTAAYSLTNMQDDMFTKSFTEHGIVIGLAVVRTQHTYQQGINRMFSRKNKFDYYWPTLANIGEQAILNKEIYAQGTEEDDEAFGYQEAWADLRYKPSMVTGAFRSNYAQSLDVWHYADDYDALPTLSSEWIDETRKNMNRTIAVSDELEDQFIADFYFRCDMTRPMPLYSIPGLLDHH